MTVRHIVAITAVAVFCLGLLGCANSDDITLQGSGATFPAPLYKRWFLEYYKDHPEVRVNYTPIGSGAGIRQFSTRGLTDFAASDAGINADQQKHLPPEYGGCVILPMTAGSIVLSYNLPGVTQPIRLLRQTYLKIFLNEITNWDDEAIAKTNPGVNFGGRDITIIRRADSSGTSFAFTNHMNAVAKAEGLDWKPGVGTSPNWGKSLAAQGNDGIAALVQMTPGAIGYLEFGYAELAQLPMASLENHHHKFVVPSNDTGRKALEGASIPPDLQIKVPDPSVNEDAYPIVTYTWVICKRVYDEQKTADTLKAVLRFCLEGPQQETAEKLGYIRLPPDVIGKCRDEIEKIGAKD
jgi:phosphate transport system substrate-binding protein